MNVIATARYVRQSPRKVRLVATAVRSLPPVEAVNALSLMNARAAQVVQDVLKSAIANATNNFQLPVSELRIATLEVGEGPTLKRMRAASKGRGVSVMKRTSHVRVVLTNEPAAPKKSATPRKDRRNLKTNVVAEAVNAETATPKNTEKKSANTRKATKETA
jgi:large subunit ribosomal protein L22